jgi:hypothetical protein
VIARQIELANAARDCRAVLDRHQPFVLAQVLADLAMHRQKRCRRLFNFVERAGQCLFGNIWIVAE